MLTNDRATKVGLSHPWSPTCRSIDVVFQLDVPGKAVLTVFQPLADDPADGGLKLGSMYTGNLVDAEVSIDRSGDRTIAPARTATPTRTVRAPTPGLTAEE